jgi:hypothetical protein
MSEDFIKIENAEMRSLSSEIAIYELPLSTEVRAALKAKGLPYRIGFRSTADPKAPSLRPPSTVGEYRGRY